MLRAALQIREFRDFVREKAADLLWRPSNTFQTASNAPIQSAPAAAARAMLAAGLETRIWLESRNRKQVHSFSLNPALKTSRHRRSCAYIIIIRRAVGRVSLA